MKEKVRKSFLVMLVLTLVMQLCPMQALANPLTEDGEHKAGYMPLELEEIELSAEDVEDAVTQEAQEGIDTVYAISWSDYESRYYYNLMTPAKRVVYDGLYAQCMNLLTTQADAVSKSGYLMTDLVEYTGLSDTELKEVVYLFTISNPQFYFIQETAAIIGYQGGRDYVALKVYSDYASGATRANYTHQFATKVNGWISTVSAQPDEYSKAKAAHDIVCSNLSYDYDGDWGRHQSAATAVFEGVTVCAGYAQVYAMLCNASGVSALCVTSYDHEWNQVYVGGRWQAVDCTADDNDTSWGYAYFLKSDKQMQDGYHNPEAYLAAYRPVCPDNLTSVGIYLWQYENLKIEGGAVVNENCDKSALQYRWLVYDVNNNNWILANDWSYDYGIHYYPQASGDYLVRCDVRDADGVEVSATVGVNYRHVINQTCQIPYEGNQYLIGVQSFNNPNNEYSYEMLILDCNLFSQGLPAWVYTTGALKTQGDTMWTTWAPQPGNYWTLFRVYDKNGNMIDQVCYGFTHQ